MGIKDNTERDLHWDRVRGGAHGLNFVLQTQERRASHSTFTKTEKKNHNISFKV